jgi:hypothetical protein
MSRNLTTAMKTALAGVVVRPVLLVQQEFRGTTINIWTGLGPLVWDGKTWLGVGDLLAVSELEENSDVSAKGMTISLKGVKSSDISLALAGMARNKPGKIWLALLDASGSVIANPKIMFSGKLDTCTVEDGADTCTISIALESELIDLERPREVRLTDQEQQKRFPGDRGLENIAALQDANIPWGAR